MTEDLLFSQLPIVPAQRLAESFGFAGVTDAFRNWCRTLGISAVPGRPGYFDLALVRVRLNLMQGIEASGAATSAADRGAVLLSNRRARRGTH